MEQRPVGKDCVYICAAGGWVCFDVIVDGEEERTSEGFGVRVRCGLVRAMGVSGDG